MSEQTAKYQIGDRLWGMRLEFWADDGPDAPAECVYLGENEFGPLLGVPGTTNNKGFNWYEINELHSKPEAFAIYLKQLRAFHSILDGRTRHVAQTLESLENEMGVSSAEAGAKS